MIYILHGEEPRKAKGVASIKRAVVVKNLTRSTHRKVVATENCVHFAFITCTLKSQNLVQFLTLTAIVVSLGMCFALYTVPYRPLPSMNDSN